MGTLYLVATPIGTLEDMSQRGINILKSVRLIAAEDTRHTKKLLVHFQIDTQLTSYHEHNKLVKLDSILSTLALGDVALVSDAGTPGLNDPGYELVRAVLEAGYLVSPIPGPSAPIAALVVSGLPTDAFLYLGYLPRTQNARRKLLSAIAGYPYTLIFLETPHRLLEALADMSEVLGARKVCLARELTKLYEDIYHGDIPGALARYRAETARGEFTLVIAGNPARDFRWSEAQLIDAITQQFRLGMTPAQISAGLVPGSGWRKREIYRLVLQFMENERNEPG
jgi:16S rRNA (cytidine1402-2'-O)-methyltransferase